VTLTMRGRHFLKELDFTPEEWRGLLALSASLKADKKAGAETQRLRGKNIALIFEKTSTRTRCAFEVAAYDQGAHTTFLDPKSSQLGHKESVADTAQVLGRMYDGIEYRGSAQTTVDTLAEYAGVPVFNGLTDEWHPTQALCDSLTMREHAGKPDEEIAFAYCGDARNNVAHSLLVTGAMLGMDVRIVAPPSLQPDPAVTQAAEKVAASTGARLRVTDEVDSGVGGVGVDFIHTDVWVSMGEPKEVWDQRIELLKPYQINRTMLERSKNPDVKVMHCLPAFHDINTELGAQIAPQYGMSDGLEITDDVFQSPATIVFDQAENRMHTIKAILVATMA
jgi:ornithine carbamoyltransferase